MTIDDLAREAAADLRRAAAHELVPDVMLARLHQARRRRSIALTTATAVVVAVVVGVAALGTTRTTTATPPATSGPSTGASTEAAGRCADPNIRCLGHRRYRVALAVPVTVQMPGSFDGQLAILSEHAVEAYRKSLTSVGVTVLEDARPVQYDDTWTRDPAAGSTAESMAEWLSQRPFLDGATVAPTTVGGLAAWHVNAPLRDGARLPAMKGGYVAPTFAGDATTMGSSPSLQGDYTLVDVPGAGVTVIWSWSHNNGRGVLAGNQAYVDGLSFG